MGTGSAGAGRADRVPARALPPVAGGRAAVPLSEHGRQRAGVADVSIELKIFGPNVTITQKDPSALNALLFSALALSSGRARAMLAGAVDEWNFFYAMGFDRVGALRGEKRASGIVQGEGAFVVLLEDEESARARGARPLARLAGIATAGVAVRAVPLRARTPPRSARAIRGALDDAGARPGGRSASGSRRATASTRWTARRPRSCARSSARRCPASSPSRTRSARWPRPAARSSSRPRARLSAGNGGPRRALVNSFGAGGNFLAAVLEAAA